VSEVDIKKKALVEIVGAGHVCDDPAILDGYATDCSYAPKRKPWFVVRPSTGEQVQALVTWANQTETPLIPVSSGPPHFHGDTVPGVPESVIVDLSRMKEIKRIDRRNKMVVIEPGMTYSELEPALAKEGLRISRPLLPRPNKSVIASLLERQPTLIPRFNYSLPEPLRNCGVVWGSGEIAFTGEAGNGPLDLELQWRRGVAQIDPKGPNATDLMRLLTGAQGSMGIVIWASIKCELVPSVHKYVFIPGERIEDLIDFCYKVERIRLGDEVLLVNAAQLATILSSQHDGVPGLKETFPAWAVVIGLAGTALFPEERVRVQELDLKRLVQQCGLTLLNGVPNVTSREVASAFERCSGEPYFKFQEKGACQDIFFLTTLDKTPQFVSTVFSIAERLRYPTSDIGVYIQPQHHGVSQHLEFNIPFDPADSKEAIKVKQVYDEASAALIAQGAYFSRPYGSWAAMVYSRDVSATRVLRTVKHIVDPNNVLNPGKLCF
jgi:FAD/FMN-containing dehydrogenase